VFILICKANLSIAKAIHNRNEIPIMCDTGGNIMVVVFFLALAVSIDALGLGISFGVRQIKLGLAPALTMSGVGLVAISLSMLLGKGIQGVLSHNIGGIALICIGAWVLFQAFKKNEDVSQTVKILRSPDKGDIDGSGNIDCFEAVFLGLALSMDAVGVGIGSACIPFAMLLPLAAMVLQMLLVFVGIKLGSIIGHTVNTSVCTVLSGLFIVVIGLFNFFC
jgi:putative sporulation protein YtaF